MSRYLMTEFVDRLIEEQSIDDLTATFAHVAAALIGIDPTDEHETMQNLWNVRTAYDARMIELDEVRTASWRVKM